MRLVSFAFEGKNSYGVLGNDGRILDLAPHLGTRFGDLKSVLAAGGFAEVASVVNANKPNLSLDEVTLLPPIPNPGTIWCAGMNTHSHFNEVKELMGMDKLPPKPILFMRSAACLTASGQPLEKPKLEERFDFEGEIALIIGKRGRNIAVEDAMQYVAGYSAFNEASCRNYQRTSSQMTAGKNGYRTGGFGPCLATPDEVDLDTMTLTCTVNGKQMQHMSVDDLIFGFAELMAFISEFTWLEPGDVIVTGSPEGIGSTRKPPELLNAGDRVEIDVTGVGTLVNVVEDQVI